MSDQTSGPDAIDVDVGRRIRVKRKVLGVTQSALAEYLGVTFQQVQKYERGANRVSASMLVRAAEKLQTTVAELVGEAGGLSQDSEVVRYLATPGAVELVRVYAATRPRLRLALLSLARSMSDEPD